MKKTSYIYLPLALCCLSSCIEATEEYFGRRVQLAPARPDLQSARSEYQHL